VETAITQQEIAIVNLMRTAGAATEALSQETETATVTVTATVVADLSLRATIAMRSNQKFLLMMS
jgi:hypothetical protein